MNSILEVNVDSILNNLENLNKKNKTICIPVKGNAYGLGYGIVDYFIKYGYNFFGVSTLEEALCIRKKYKEVNILLFSSVFLDELNIIEENNIGITVYDMEILKNLTQNIKFHLKIDVGMGRLGFLERDIKEVINILRDKQIKPEGIYTHLPNAVDENESNEQIKSFEEIVNKFKEFDIQYIHYANGLSALKYDTDFDNMIRPGLATYGYLETGGLDNIIGAKITPSVNLKVRCGHVKQYSGKIGYNGIDEVTGTILTFPIGYHDGLKQAYVGYEIKDVGKIVGKICMCQFMVLGSKNDIHKGDYIYFFKGDSVYKLSEYSNVSIYEIFSNLSNRIERKYIEEEDSKKTQ